MPREVDLLRAEVNEWKTLAGELYFVISSHHNRVDELHKRYEILDKAKRMLGIKSEDPTHA